MPGERDGLWRLASVLAYQDSLGQVQLKVDQFGHLTLAQVYAALAYYHANRDEIDADLAEEDRLFDALTAEQFDKAS